MLHGSTLKLLDKERLIVTGPLDKAKWNYSPMLSLVERARFRLIVQLIASRQYGDLLEIGYGSGVFMPELRRRCVSLHGIDIHQHANAVKHALAEAGVEAALHTGSVESLPFESGSFDLVVSVSALEYVSDKRKAACEIRRVLRPQGCVAVIYPLPNVISDIALNLLTMENAAQYGDGRHRLLPSLLEQFSVVQCVHFPAWMPRSLQIYEAALLAPRH